jgi:hypothetical protein
MKKSKKPTKKSKKKSDGARGRRGAVAPPPTARDARAAARNARERPPPTARDARAAARNAQERQPPVVRERPARPAQQRPVPAAQQRQPPVVRVQQQQEEDELPIYCGNNAMHPGLINGTARAGSRLDCLRRGFGAGFHSAVDLSFLQPYRPIDERKKYCGDQEILPDGYDMFGNAPSCFQKGWATGKRSRAMNPNGRRRRRR